MKNTTDKAPRELGRRDLLRSAAVAAAGLSVGRSIAWGQAACGQACGMAGGVAGPAAEVAGAKDAGWKVLFDGKDLTQWDYKPEAWQIQDDKSLYSPGKGGDIYSKEKFQDFSLLLDFKVSKGCNSGVFVRMADRKDWLHSSIEFQVLDSFGKAKVGIHDCMAMYDCKAPDHNAVKKADEWNKVQITCFKNRIFIALNGIQVQDIDLNQWDTAGKNPDGSKNKFRDPLKKIQHPGFLALQTHGRPVWYRNVQVKPLAALAKCPKCGREGPEGWYCAKCGTVCAPEGTIKCAGCGQDAKAGTYCAKGNGWHLAGGPACACGKTAGMWCAPCDTYYMTGGVAYSEKCKKPYAKTPAGCPKCGKKEG